MSLMLMLIFVPLLLLSLLLPLILILILSQSMLSSLLALAMIVFLVVVVDVFCCLVTAKEKNPVRKPEDQNFEKKISAGNDLFVRRAKWGNLIFLGEVSKKIYGVKACEGTNHGDSRENSTPSTIPHT